MIFEGILSFCDDRLIQVCQGRLTVVSIDGLSHRNDTCLPYQLCDMKIFVDTDPDIRLARRLTRDLTDRGRDLDGVLKQYMKFVKPSYDHCIAPTMRHADIIVPRGRLPVRLLSLIDELSE